jgi:hypothetical protein
MKMFGKMKKININGKELEIKELRVKEIRILKDVVASTQDVEKEVIIEESVEDYFIGATAIEAEIEGKRIPVVDGAVKIKGKAAGECVKIQTKQGKSPEQLMLGIADKLIGLTKDEIDELYPSQIEEIIAAVKEVNSGFLNLLAKMGIKIEDLQKQVEASFQVN